jgi:integrase
LTAEGSVYQRKDGRWVAQYKDARGKTRYIYRKTKQEAKQALREALRDRDDGIVPPSKMTVGMYLDEWLEDRRETLSRRTWVCQESLIRTHVKSHPIGSKKLPTLSGKDVRSLYRQKVEEGLSATTVGHMNVLLKQAMRDAVRSKYIRANPLEDVKPPKQTQKEKDVLTPEQVKHLLEVVRGDRFECVYTLAALCALRLGEVLALRWDAVDLDRGTIKIERTLWNGKTSHPKTPSSRRTLALPMRAIAALVRLSGTSDRQEGYLFATSSGKPIDASNFYKWSWKPILRKADLPESLTPHQLRHGAASLLLNQNVPIPVVSRYLGHANPGITLKVYAHQIEGTSDMAANAIDDLLQ